MLEPYESHDASLAKTLIGKYSMTWFELVKMKEPHFCSLANERRNIF